MQKQSKKLTSTPLAPTKLIRASIRQKPRTPETIKKVARVTSLALRVRSGFIMRATMLARAMEMQTTRKSKISLLQACPDDSGGEGDDDGSESCGNIVPAVEAVETLASYDRP